jgi:hypothetical protein
LRTLVGLALLTPVQAHAGAWTLEEGQGIAVLALNPSTADQIFNGSHKLQTTPRYNKFEFQALFEYGVRDWFTVIVAPGVQHIDIAAPVDAKRTGLGFTEFGGRLRIFHSDNWVVSTQATIRIPGTFDASNPAAIGHNGFEHDLRLLVGHSFRLADWPAFVDLQFAQRFRSGERPSEVRIDAALGVRPAPQWLMLAQLFNVISEGDSPPLFPSYDYSKLQLSVVYEVTPHWALQAGGFTTFHGRNALQENGLLAAVWYRFPSAAAKPATVGATGPPH